MSNKSGGRDKSASAPGARNGKIRQEPWDPFAESPAPAKKSGAKATVKIAPKPVSKDIFFSDELFDAPGESVKPRARKSARRGGKRAERWAAPVAASMVVVLALMAFAWTERVSAYSRFQQMRSVVNRQTFYPGILVDGLDVSDLTFQQAAAKWAEEEQRQQSRYEVTLRYEGQSWALSSADLGYYSDYVEVLSRAFAVGRYGSLEERYHQASSISDGEKREYTVTRGANRDALISKVSAIADELTIEPQNAQIQSFDRNTLTFVYTQSQYGLVVDKQALYNKVVQAVNENTSFVEITRERVAPTRTASDLTNLYGEISSATTNASSSTSNRITNIRLACSAVDSTLIKPGETFSFNEVVGKRTSDRGYKKAGAIENGIMTDQYGGGICQVSTTLFNAVVKANLTIVERNPHSRPSTYIDIGKDAAVDWPNQDLKFRNDSSNPVYLVAYVTDDKRVVVKVFGEKLPNGGSIRIDSKRTATTPAGADRYVIDETLPTGAQQLVEKARDGAKAEAYKVYLDKDGNEIKSELLCKSSYAAAGAIIRIGP